MLALGPEQPLGGEDPLEPLQAGEQLADADRPDLQDAERERPRLIQKSGLACTTTRAPSVTAGPAASNTARGPTTRTDMFATGSRSVM